MSSSCDRGARVNGLPVVEMRRVSKVFDRSADERRWRSLLPGPAAEPRRPHQALIDIDLTVARYLPAGVTVSPFVFVMGGVDGDNNPLAAVGKTFW